MVAPGRYTTGHPNYDAAIIHIYNNHDITIKRNPVYPNGDVTLDGNKNNVAVQPCQNDPTRISNYLNYTQYGIRIQQNISSQTVNNITIENIYFINFRENAIKVRCSYLPPTILNVVNIIDCHFNDIIGVFNACDVEPPYGTSCAAIHAQNVTDLTITHCTIHLDNYGDNGRAAQTDGIYLGAVKNVLIDSTYISVKNNFTTNYPGVDPKLQQPHIDAIQIANETISQTLVLSSNIYISKNNVNNLSTITAPIGSNHYYANRQGIYAEKPSGYLAILNNVVRSERGNGLIAVALSANTSHAYVFNNTLIGNGNQQLLANFSVKDPVINYGSNLKIKDNIFYKINPSQNALGTVKFGDINYSEYLTTVPRILEYNLYFINVQNGIPQVIFTNNGDQPVPFDDADPNGINDNPLFTNFAQGDFTLEYLSPAKNAGIGLNTDYGLNTDNNNHPRPYWDKDYDIGAYEVQNDANVKIGISTNIPNKNFIIRSLGTYWERNLNGDFVISSNNNFVNSTVTATVNNNDLNLNSWKGWNLGWLNNGSSNLIKPLAHGIYKMYMETDSSNFIYLDYRDPINLYSPNIFIQFNTGLTKFQYRNGNEWITLNQNEWVDIIRIWELNNNNNSNTSGLSSYWSHALAWSNERHETATFARLIWGPYTSGEIDYYVHRNYGGYQNILPDPEHNSPYSYLDNLPLSIPGGQSGTDVPYYISMNDQPGVGSQTNTEIINVFGDKIDKKSGLTETLEYKLSQNFPNPFNPTTNILFSLRNPEIVTIKVYDILGREIKTLLHKLVNVGEHSVQFNASDLSSGIYFYRIIAGEYSEFKKMQLLK